MAVSARIAIPTAAMRATGNRIVPQGAIRYQFLNGQHLFIMSPK
jgi:hypothetical protein